MSADQKEPKLGRPLTCLSYSIRAVDGQIAISQLGAPGEEDDVIFLTTDQIEVFCAHLRIIAAEVQQAVNGRGDS